MTIAGRWAKESEERLVTAASFEEEARWDREHGVWVFADGSHGCFTKTYPVMEKTSAGQRMHHYRFEEMA